MKAFKKITAFVLLAMVAIGNVALVNAHDIKPDLTEGAIGEQVVTGDGQRIVYFMGEEVKARKEHIYGGFVFDHNSSWNSDKDGVWAHAYTYSYAKGNSGILHYHYTRARIQDRLGFIVQDSGRQWGNGYSVADTEKSFEYSDRLTWTMRSYWGDETTDE